MILGFVIVVGAAGYLGYRGVATAQTPASPLDAPVTVPVMRGNVQQTVSAPGALAGTREVVLSLPVAGRVADIAVRAGERVQAGETLIALDPGELKATEQCQYVAYLQAQLAYSQTVQGPDPAEAQAAETALLSARAAYTALLLPPTANELAAVEATLHNAEAALQAAQRDYETKVDRSAASLALEHAQNNHFDAVPDALARGVVTRINPLRLAGARPLYGVYISRQKRPLALWRG